MNCKPGDLAIVYRRPECPGSYNGMPMTVQLLMTGTVVRVMVLSERYAESWMLEEEVHGVRWESSIGGSGTVTVCGIPDQFLRPLPPLSEDEHDQAWVGKPEQVAA